MGGYLGFVLIFFSLVVWAKDDIREESSSPICGEIITVASVSLLSPDEHAILLFSRLWSELDPDNVEPERMDEFKAWLVSKQNGGHELLELRREFLNIVDKRRYDELSRVNQARANFIVGRFAHFPHQAWANGRQKTLISGEEVRALFQLGQFQGASWQELSTILLEQGYRSTSSPINRIGKIYVKSLESGRTVGARLDPPARGTRFAHAHKESVLSRDVIDGRYESNVPGLRRFDDQGNFIAARWAAEAHIPIQMRRRRSNSDQ